VVRVADASVAIRGDMSGFSSDLKRAERETGGFAARIRGLLTPKGLLGAGALFGLGSSIPTLTRQVIGFAGDAAQSYGELQQTVRTIDNVFGESAQVIRDWGKTAADTAGMSQQTFMSSAAIMGQTLLNMGFEQEEAAQKVTLLLQRAADMALAFGKRPQDALLAITAAMRGERDTIEKFGVAIKQVDVNARISALGLDTSTAAAKKNAEAIAVVDLVLAQSAESAGRFAASQDDVAAKMATANAKIEDFMTTQVGPAVASIQLGAIKAAEAVGGFFDTSAGNISQFALFFGDQRVKIDQEAQRLGTTFNELRDKVATLMEDGMTFEMALDVVSDPQAATDAAIELGEATRRGMAAEKAGVEDAATEALMDPIIEALLGGKEEAARIAGETPDAISQALIDNQFSVENAAASLAQAIEDALDPVKEQAQIEGFLASDALADGLASNVPAVAQRARELKAAAESRLAELKGAAFFWGLNSAQSYASGLNAGYGYVRDAAGNLAAATRNQIGINSEPADHSSPLYGITKWGGNIVKTMAEGIYGELGTGSAAAGALAGALVPSLAGGAMGYGGGVAASQTINYNLHVSGVPKQVRSPEEMVEELLALSAFSEGRLA
jgi:hypothetical protein